MQLNDKVLEDLYQWIDSLPLSRPKKRIERDFADGKLIAEIIHYYLPQLVDLHNYTSANSLDQKKLNWLTLNKKVLSNFGLDIPDVIIVGLSNCKPGLIEVLLFNLRLKIDEELELQTKLVDQPLRHTSLSSIRTSPAQAKFNLTNLNRLNYEEIKQQYFQQEEQLESLESKLRRLEHVLQLKDKRIEQLSKNIENDHFIKSHRSNK